MIKNFKKAIKRYDEWCKSLGLTPEQKRCCVPIKKEDIFEPKEKKNE
ncbi:DUF5363 family protein [Vibrio sp. F74]